MKLWTLRALEFMVLFDNKFLKSSNHFPEKLKQLHQQSDTMTY